MGVSEQLLLILSDDTFASLQQLWDCAWANPAAEAELFETREVIRDGTLPEVTVTPEKCRVLTIPGNVLRQYSDKSILIRPECIIALAFAIFVAQGGNYPGVFAEKKIDDEEDDDLHRTSQNEWDSIMQPNPCSQILSRLLMHGPLLNMILLTSATRVPVRKSFFNESEYPSHPWASRQGKHCFCSSSLRYESCSLSPPST